MPNTVSSADIDSVEVGLVLVDSSLKSIGFDRGGALMLGYAPHLGLKGDLASYIPKEILSTIRARKPLDLALMRISFRVGENEYLCRIHVVEAPNRLWREPVLALYLQKATVVNRAVHDITRRYHLTGREAEVLRGMCAGLAPKELAKRLNISPNTVKSFIRLIMTKMRVTTRAEMFAIILERQGNSDHTPELSHALESDGSGGIGF
jgi:DNA-binding CsgD family transcriptional regulator